MKGKALKKITVFLLALILAVPAFSWNNVRTVQAATVKTTALKSISAVKKGVKITWKKTSGASGYYVYRKTGNGKWKKIATLKKSSITSYTDKKVTSGNKYTYTVKGYKGILFAQSFQHLRFRLAAGRCALKCKYIVAGGVHPARPGAA